MAFSKLFLLLATLLVNHSDKAKLDENLSLSQKSIRYISLGDSYTIGEGVVSELNYPHILEKEMKNAGFNIEETKVIAKTGWRTDDLLKAIEQENISGTYELVTLLIGVNNQYQH
jgi:acyl-CoA thioesterase-1